MKVKSLISCFIIFFFLLAADGSTQNFDYDILIKNGRVYDGSANSSFKSDVAVKNGKIVKVSKSIRGSARKTINARGLYITPGFIDLHTHVDRGMYFPENRPLLNYLYQGVTTIIVGQCGSSAWPIFEQAEDQMKRWTEEGIGPNAALLVGHGTVREIVMGRENRAPTAEELGKMKVLVKQAMDQGAYGMSTGLIYVPGSYSETDEIIELVKVIVPYGGMYHSHIRNENTSLIDAIEEAIKIGEETGVHVHISHFKVMNKENWGTVKEACRLIEEARSNGLKITADQYPYEFSNNYPYTSLIPSNTWRPNNGTDRISTDDIEAVFDNLRDSELLDLYYKATPYYPISEHHQQFLDNLSRKRLVTYVAQNMLRTRNFRGIDNARERRLFIDRLKNPEEATKIREAVLQNIERTGADRLIVGICVDREFEGKTLKEVSEIKGNSLEDTAIELELMGAKIVPLRISDDDIEYIMKKDYVGTGSDGAAPFYGIGYPHLRSYSTFLHKIKKYARERKAVSVEHVIRSQTSLPAEIMNFTDKGWIKEGFTADILVLDLKNIETRTSISNAHQYCKGVKHLLINGKLIIDDEKYTGSLPGKIIMLKN